MKIAVRAPPTWRYPVGEGANRSLRGAIARAILWTARPGVKKQGRIQFGVRMRPHTRRGTPGFTLVEVLVALLVLTLVILTSLGVFTDRMRRVKEAGEMALAWQALANEAEARRRQPFDALAPAEGLPFLTDATGEGTLEGAEGVVTVTEEEPNLRALLLRVEWRGGSRAAETVVYRASTGAGALW